DAPAGAHAVDRGAGRAAGGRRHFPGQAVRHAAEAGHWRGHVRGVAARDLLAEEARVALAEAAPAGLAVGALAAGESLQRGRPVADRPAVDSLAQRDDLAGRLVAEDGGDPGARQV